MIYIYPAVPRQFVLAETPDQAGKKRCHCPMPTPTNPIFTTAISTAISTGARTGRRDPGPQGATIRSSGTFRRAQGGGAGGPDRRRVGEHGA